MCDNRPRVSGIHHMYSSYELQEWCRVLWHPVVRPGSELELFNFSPISIAHLRIKIYQT